MNKFASLLKNKLKIYSVLLAIVLVGKTFFSMYHYPENYSSNPRDEEVLTLDSLTEEFAKVDKKTTVYVDTINGKCDTTSTRTDYKAYFKPFLKVTVPVRPRLSAIDKFLYTKVEGQPCMVEMQEVSFIVPMEKRPFVFTFITVCLICTYLPLAIWLLVIILKVIRSVYKGEIFVSQIAKRLKTAGKLLVTIWLVVSAMNYFYVVILRETIMMAYYDIKYQTADILYIVFGLVLMILSQIILKGKDLKDEQELTI